MNEISIRAMNRADYTQWREMWDDYCVFYQTSLPDTVTDGLWSRLLMPSGPVRGIVAVETTTENILGFAHYVLHPHTWSDKTLCYLEDLYVRPEGRGSGIGHALIEHLTMLGREQGWGRVYWHTNADNAPARRLYDRFCPADTAVRYTISL